MGNLRGNKTNANTRDMTEFAKEITWKKRVRSCSDDGTLTAKQAMIAEYKQT
jgi:hypothetical protein